MKRFVLYLWLSSTLTVVYAQTVTQKEIQSAAAKQLPLAIAELRQFLQLKNDGHYPDQIQENLKWCMEAMKKRKFETRILGAENISHVFAQRIYNAKLPTLLVYLQIDGQPVDPASWEQKDPFDRPYKPDSRIFARSASDSKGPAMAFLSSLDILEAKGMKPQFNIKIIMDFQEEMGSPTLSAVVKENKELLAAKYLLIMDGTRHISNLPTLNFGARGLAEITLKVFGAKGDLHSGQYGNFAPNPVFKLAKLLAGMKDEEGRVLIPGFYDGVLLSEEEKVMINSIPESKEELMNTLGIAAHDRVGSTYQESLQYPSLNVLGLKAATIGKEANTIIPAEAIAELDMRLVPETPGERQVELLKEYIRSQGFHFVNGTPTEEERKSFTHLIAMEYTLGSKPFRTDLNSPMGQWLGKAMDRTFGQGNYVKQRATGGSQPIEPFISTLGVPAVSIRMPNPDNNIHAANENIRMANFLEGIQMCLGILTQKVD
jgi:acetylornithine deacetylase/succinyl-diaminopimelate desuccinylase-like protein